MASELKEVYSDFEAEFWPQFDKVSSFTMTSPERLYSLWNMAKYVKQNDISGDFVECGVWRGGSSMMAALALMAQGDFSRRLWLYDTFEGMPTPGAKDVQIRSGKHAQTYLDTEERLPAYNTWAIAHLDEVQRNLYSTGYPPDKMIFRKGLVQDTLLQKLPDKIAILRLDTDWYDSTLTELKILWPRLVPSGLLFIDDYGWWKGQRQAVDEYFSTQRFKPYFFRIDVAMVMVVKPAVLQHQPFWRKSIQYGRVVLPDFIKIAFRRAGVMSPWMINFLNLDWLRSTASLSRPCRIIGSENLASILSQWWTENRCSKLNADLHTMQSSRLIDRALVLPPGFTLPKRILLEQYVLFEWEVIRRRSAPEKSHFFRRAIPGFHPEVYAVEHTAECELGGQNPTVHWLQNGQPNGNWVHPVFSPASLPAEARQTARVALHAHFYYPDLAGDLARRLVLNNSDFDLFVSTDSDSKAHQLKTSFSAIGRSVTIRVVPNRGRDIGPLLTGFGDKISSEKYDIWGHVHGKKSSSIQPQIGEDWRNFLWENLVGGKYQMLDVAVNAFDSDPLLGLLFAEEPHLVGWNDNLIAAETLAGRLGLTGQLPEFLDFPVGSMFWFRPGALRPLMKLALDWDDYPAEPLPYDGSLLHAIERILPLVAKSEKFSVATLQSPGTSW